MWIQAYTGVMCGSCSPGYGKSPSMTCEECPKWYILYPRLALAIIQMMITSLLFIKGANDYAKDTLSRGTLQRSQMINARSLEEYLHGHGMEEAFEENVNGLHQQRTLLDPTDILKVHQQLVPNLLMCFFLLAPLSWILKWSNVVFK